MTVQVCQQSDVTTSLPRKPGLLAEANTLSEISCLDGGSWRLFLLDQLSDQGVREELDRLSKKYLDPNPFYALPFFKSAIEHLGKGKVSLLCLAYRESEGTQQIRLAIPVVDARAPFGQRRVLRSWTTHYSPLGSPLVDREEHEHTVAGFIDCLLNWSPQSAEALVLDELPVSSRFFRSLYANGALADQSLRYNCHTRASINSQMSLCTIVERVSGKRRQRLNKARRDLAKLGPVSFHVSAAPGDVRSALADHLVLEDQGWKGKKGTSIVKDLPAYAVAQSAIPAMARENTCSVYSLKMNGAVLASMIMLRHRDSFFPWKIAFDEKFGKYSVGNLLLDHVNTVLSKERSFSSLDSLASEINQTARRFWTEELEMTSFVIGLGENAADRAVGIARSEARSRRFKSYLKKIAGRSL